MGGEKRPQALSEALSGYEEECGVVEDPAEIRVKWLRRAVLKFTRDTLPTQGSGPHTTDGKPAFTSRERQAAYRTRGKQAEEKLREQINRALDQVSARNRNSQQMRAATARAVNTILTKALANKNFSYPQCRQTAPKRRTFPLI